MRRLLVVLFVLAAAGCSADSEQPATAPTPPPASAPGGSAAPAASTGAAPGKSGAKAESGDKALAGNTKAICAQATRVNTSFASMFAEDLKMLIDTSSKSDPAAAEQVKQKTTRDVHNYSSALADMSNLTADPKVKQALANMSKQVAALDGDVRKLDAKKLAEIDGGLDGACGTA